MAGKNATKRVVKTALMPPSTKPRVGLLRAAIDTRPPDVRCITCKLDGAIVAEINELIREGKPLAWICRALQDAYDITLGVTTLNNHKRDRHHERSGS